METKHITVEQEQRIKEFLSKYSTLSESSIPSHINIYKKLFLTGNPGYQKISKERISLFFAFMNKETGNKKKEKSNSIPKEALVKSTNKNVDVNNRKVYNLTEEQEEKINVFLEKNHNLSENSKNNLRTAYRKLLCTGDTWPYISKCKRDLFLSYMKGEENKEESDKTKSRVPIIDLIQKEDSRDKELFSDKVKCFLDSFTYRNRHLSEQLKNRLFQFITDKFTGSLEKDRCIIKAFNEEDYSFYESYSSIIDSCFREIEHKENFVQNVSDKGLAEGKYDNKDGYPDTMVGLLRERLEFLSNKLGELVEEINTIRIALKYI